MFEIDMGPSGMFVTHQWLSAIPNLDRCLQASCARRGLVVTSRRHRTQSWTGYQQVCQRYISTCLSKMPISYQQDTVDTYDLMTTQNFDVTFLSETSFTTETQQSIFLDVPPPGYATLHVRLLCLSLGTVSFELTTAQNWNRSAGSCWGYYQGRHLGGGAEGGLWTPQGFMISDFSL